ncbi:uncharacterized protein LOC130725530 [Lotus japonicus]|uniref:uncharacterized protein LOC130725530 n=1 Tax=Lotus japonicus TaxID=34305 RepID=UPI00258F9DCB|nr:uncharacterized protein LOC130725530 [Lotus japonicus]
MAFVFDDLANIDASKDSWKILVKVLRLWSTRRFSRCKISHVDELLLMDSKISDSCKLSYEEDFLVVTPRKTIQEKNLCLENSVCVVSGIIKEIIGLKDLWYIACKCNKFFYPDEKMYFCENCNRHVVAVFQRHQIKVRVSDEVEDVVFILFDKESTTLLGKTCDEMISSLHKGDYSMVAPSEILALVGKSFIFKVGIKIAGNPKFDTSYHVKRVDSDYPSFISISPSHNKRSAVIYDLAKDMDDDFIIVL